MKRFLLIILLAICFHAVGAEAANHYVRSGASGSGTGADWTNAYTNLPATLTRGDTYYLATGNYSGSGFQTAVSGSTYIYVKKATASDHGTGTGWSSSYGTGQAVFGGTWMDIPNAGYLEINGQEPYGIKFVATDVSAGHAFVLQYGTNVHIYYAEFSGPGSTGYYNYQNNIFGFWQKQGGTTDGFLMSHCASHGVVDPIHWDSGNNAVFEYNDIHDNENTGSNHTNAFYIASTGEHDITIRYNKFHDYDTEGIFFSSYPNAGLNNIYIYGNVFYNGVGSARGVADTDAMIGEAYFIYNNTFVDMPIGGVLIRGTTSGGAVRNNIGYNASISPGSIPSSNNLSVSSSAFVNYASRNFHLASATSAGYTLSSSYTAATSAGYTLSSSYNQDMDGNTRGADGIWDIGAYEYNAGGGGGSMIKPSTPMNLHIN